MKGLPRSLSNSGLSGAITAALLLNAVPLNVVDGAPGFGFAAIGTFPPGEILLLGGFAELIFTTASANVTATWTGSYAIGTAGTVDSDVADAGEAIIVQSTVISAATAKVSPETKGLIATANCGTIISNQAGTQQIFLNLLIDDASISGAAAFTVSGKLKLGYMNLGS